KSIRPFKSSEEYLYAMKEDLAEWLKDLYDMDISGDYFLEALETGFVLCQHANNVTRVARDFAREYPQQAFKLPKLGVSVNPSAQPGTFLARDNVSNFIHWCRKEMAIQDVLMFETEDLVLRKNEKNFILCLLEVARRASRFGMIAPILIQMEEEIEEEIREELDLPPVETPIPKPQRQRRDFKNLDEMVQHLVSRCTCPVQFAMIKVSEGKYKVGDSSTLIFVRILRNHVMVRVGGGWDTLEHYLDKHDPCCCTSLSHKQAMRFASPQRTLMPMHEIKSRLTPKADHPSKPQPALILTRMQSPLPAVEWVPSAPSKGLKTEPASPRSLSASTRIDGKSQGSPKDLREQSDPRKLMQTRSYSRAFPNGMGQRGEECRSPRPWNSLLSAQRPSSSQLPGRGRYPTSQNGSKINQKNIKGSSLAQKHLETPATNSMMMTRSPSPTKQVHLTPKQDLKTSVRQQSETDKIPMRSSSPVKQIHKIPVRTSLALNRPPTPIKNNHVELLAKDAGKLTVNEATSNKDKNSKLRNTMKIDYTKSPLQYNKIMVSVTEPSNQEEREREHICVPPPIGPELESKLYVSFENEILSNRQVLEADADETNNSDGIELKTSESDEPWKSQNTASFDHVISELCKGQKQLNRVDVEKWVAAIPSEQTHESIVEPSTPLVNGIQGKEQSSNIQKNKYRESKQMQCNNRAPHVKSVATTDCLSTTFSIDPPGPPNHCQKFRTQLGKQKRSLKKPERVPSIYKLKLRPKIRPRRDNRPEKRPSRIPTPMTHSQTRSKTSASKKTSEKSHIKINRIPRSQEQASTSTSIPTLYSIETNAEARIPGRKTLTEQRKGSKEDQGEESWV
uniref:Growth arrest specific 2 like 2 n=1 Tax=Latimeria chalumnae TaxID=7897 RepID=H3BDQ1_LATCH